MRKGGLLEVLTPSLKDGELDAFIREFLENIEEGLDGEERMEVVATPSCIVPPERSYCVRPFGIGAKL